jgi:2-polyprenyl-3-methyl-5-hydroxy-6-metoxy-1,4-benzoquinol methylase
MPSTFYLRFKNALPAPLRAALSRINQAFFARQTIQRKYGAWFDADWRKKFRSASDEDWIRTYDDVWKHYHNDCLDETDTALILAALAAEKSRAGRTESQDLESQVSVLEIGCGAGSLAIAMARAGYAVTCMDISSEALRKAKARAESEGVTIEWQQGFAENIPFADSSFDVITCCHTLEHVRDVAVTVAGMKRVARQAVVVVVPRQEYHEYMENYHTQFFSEPDELVRAFALDDYECRVIDCIDHTSEFKGEILFYRGFVQSSLEG